MRHQCKRHKLGRAQDQRKALIRSLASSLFLHGEIKTTMAKAKALKPYAENIISLAKKGDLHARRQAAALIYDQTSSNLIDEEGKVYTSVEEAGDAKTLPETILRKLFSNIAKQYEERNGGYTRIYRLPPRRGDAAEMALIQLV